MESLSLFGHQGFSFERILLYAGELFLASFALSFFISYITIAYSGLWVGSGKLSFCNGYLDMIDDVMSKCFLYAPDQCNATTSVHSYFTYR